MNEGDLTGRTLGGYRILRKLGAGGMAIVYKAHEGSLNRVVALKVIHEHLARQPEFVERFYREARAAARLTHPNIVQIYAVGDENGVPFFSMEYVKGTSLQALIETEGFLTPRRVAPILGQAAEALAAAHDAGIVHRDIKPSNIMLDGAGRVKVTDFGIAQVATDSRLTQTGMMLGTPGYSSPEQCLGGAIDSRSDIYSLGVAAYEMLTGRSPYEAETPAALVLQIVDGAPPPLATVNPTVPEDLRRIVEKMMHKNPAERFQSAEDVAEALAKAELDAAAPTVPQPRARPGPEPTRLKRPEASPPSPPEEERIESAPTEPSPAPSPAAPQGPVTPRRQGPRAGLILALAGMIGGAAAAGALLMSGLVGTHGSGQPAGAGTAATTSPAEPAAADSAAGSVTGSAAAETGAETAGGATPGAADAVNASAAAGQVAQEPAAQTGEAVQPDSAPAAPARSELAPAAPEAAPEAQPAPEPRTEPPADVAPAPRPKSIVALTAGDYEHVDLVGAGIERALVRAGFEIVDLPPATQSTQGAVPARFRVVSSVKVVGSRRLEYFGRTEIQQTVSLTVLATDLTTGTRAAGPYTTTVDYTAVNLETKLREGADKVGAELVRALDERLRSSR